MMLMLPLVVPIIITAVGIFFVYAKVGLVATMSGLVLANVMLGLACPMSSPPSWRACRVSILRRRWWRAVSA
jgi:ABC-type Fe3+ transport system permease subunit